MKTITNALIAIIAIEHIGFLILEMFLWNTPIGHKQFQITAEFAEKSSALAANQGLYNGFLAAGLIWALFFANHFESLSIKVFFLTCIVVAGIFGAATVSPSILFIQAAPALLGLVLIFLEKTFTFER